jgi:hypothetical protein
MMWAVVYVVGTGEAISFGTVVADPISDGYTYRYLSDGETEMICHGTGIWNPTTLQVEPRAAEPTV